MLPVQVGKVLDLILKSNFLQNLHLKVVNLILKNSFQHNVHQELLTLNLVKMRVIIMGQVAVYHLMSFLRTRNC